MGIKIKTLIWQWGRFGAGPRIAFELARALEQHCGMKVVLSLAEGAELLETAMCREAVNIPIKTYNSAIQFATRTVMIRKVLAPLLRRLESERPDVAISVMPGYWDLFLIRHLRRLGIPVITIIHDAGNHPGDRLQLINLLQKTMIRQSSAIVTLTDFVASSLRAQGLLKDKKHLTIPHPALTFPDLTPPPPHPPEYPQHKSLRLLLTGRLRTYKGAEMFLQAAAMIDPERLSIRIAGALNDKTLLARAKDMANVDMQSDWLSEKTFLSNIDWSDVVIIPYVEASQSGIIPVAYGRRRPVIATPVGGLSEQVVHKVTGLMSTNISPEAIAQAISSFLDRPDLLQAYAENAYLHAQNELSWKQIGRQFSDLSSQITRHG